MTAESPLQKSTNVRFFTVRALSRVAALSPTLGARLLERVFLSPRRHPAPERERAWMSAGERIPFESRGHRLGAWRWGISGPVVLLVHGWEGRGAQLGAFIAPLLERGFRVVTFDGPGHGVSEGNRSSLVELSWAVADAARAFGPFHGAVAHSAGAAATTLALRDGASIGRLVYVAPAERPRRVPTACSGVARPSGASDAHRATPHRRKIRVSMGGRSRTCASPRRWRRRSS